MREIRLLCSESDKALSLRQRSGHKTVPEDHAQSALSIRSKTANSLPLPGSEAGGMGGLELPRCRLAPWGQRLRRLVSAARDTASARDAGLGFEVPRWRLRRWGLGAPCPPAGRWRRTAGPGEPPRPCAAGVEEGRPELWVRGGGSVRLPSRELRNRQSREWLRRRGSMGQPRPRARSPLLRSWRQGLESGFPPCCALTALLMGSQVRERGNVRIEPSFCGKETTKLHFLA